MELILIKFYFKNLNHVYLHMIINMHAKWVNNKLLI